MRIKTRGISKKVKRKWWSVSWMTPYVKKGKVNKNHNNWFLSLYIYKECFVKRFLFLVFLDEFLYLFQVFQNKPGFA